MGIVHFLLEGETGLFVLESLGLTLMVVVVVVEPGERV